MKRECPCCQRESSVGATVGGKLTLAMVGAVAGHAALRHPLAGLGYALAGAYLGDFIDREVIPRCPTCAVALRVIANTI